MNLIDDSVKFCVYRHIAPDGKQYVGITSQNVTTRWGLNGTGYKDNTHFWAAICKYGWDSFVHEIVADNLSLNAACELEVFLIDKYDLTNQNKGYNHTYGGEHNFPSDEIKAKLSSKLKERWRDPIFRLHVIESLVGHPVSRETREKISKSNLGRKLDRPSPLRGKKLSDIHKAKLSGRSPWNLGKTKDTDERIAAGAMKLRGRIRSEASRLNISQAQKAKYASGYCPIWINNGVIETRIVDGDCIPEGYSIGRLKTEKRFINKDGKCIKVHTADLANYLSDGWSLGRGSIDAIKQASQKFIWSVDGIDFSTAEELASYLRSNGYPKIVASTVTSLYLKGFESSKLYADLSGRISRRPHENS